MNNVYLAFIVSFDEPYVEHGMVTMPFKDREYHLIYEFYDETYTLDTLEEVIDLKRDYGIIPDEELENVRPGVKYVYDKNPIDLVLPALENIYPNILSNNRLEEQIELLGKLYDEKHKDRPKCKIIEFDPNKINRKKGK